MDIVSWPSIIRQTGGHSWASRTPIRGCRILKSRGRSRRVYLPRRKSLVVRWIVPFFACSLVPLTHGHSHSTQKGDIILYDGHLALYKHSLDLIFYMLGGPLENELMLHSALTAFMDAIHLLLRNQVEKRAVLENLDCVILCLDETIDDGWVYLFPSGTLGCYLWRRLRIIVETDPTTIASRVSRPRADTTEIVINEQTIMNAYQTVKEKMQQRIGQL